MQEGRDGEMQVDGACALKHDLTQALEGSTLFHVLVNEVPYTSCMCYCPVYDWLILYSLFMHIGLGGSLLELFEQHCYTV